ncbi:hypothetical protein FACS189494_07660 [Spirochaetia bacterium]|nr:hypothetical protein FACS189494_07660 [Spirochaetia bacterium]
MLFLDVRYGIDFGAEKFEGTAFSGDVYKRSMLSLGLGYKIGFFNY